MAHSTKTSAPIFLVKRDKARIVTKLASRINDLGYDVSFTPAA